MNLYLLATFSTIITFICYIFFINLLYKFKMQDKNVYDGRSDALGKLTQVFDKLKGEKVGTPTGGGILIVVLVPIFVVTLHFLKVYIFNSAELTLFILTFVLFGLLGFLDDYKKVFSKRRPGLRVRHKFILQLLAACGITLWAVSHGLFFTDLAFLGIKQVDITILFLIAVFVIVYMSNAFNILDGIDGLSAGSFAITLPVLSLLVSLTTNSLTSLTFIYVLFGAVLAYLYFNVNPARVFMGDTGALAFGALIGVYSLLTGTAALLIFYGFIYIVDAFTSLLQWTSKYFRNGKKIFTIAPVHHHFEAIGWLSTKVVFRFWIIHVFMSVLSLGLFLYLMA